MKTVVILGAGFGGLELAAQLSDTVADDVRVILIDHNDGFTFGFSKIDVLFKGHTPDGVQIPYAALTRPGVEFRQERVTSIDPATRQVVTDRNEYRPDILVVALGADYDPAATPGFVEDGYDFYTVEGACRLRERLATFTGGTIVLGILSIPFKCPPAPFEAALLLHSLLVEQGIRDDTRIQLISPMPSPIPVSPSTSEALITAMSERGIDYRPNSKIHSLDPTQHLAHTDTDTMPYDLFIGVPKHQVPDVVQASGLTAGGNEGWIAVDSATLATNYPGVYAIGDCADAPVPRAGVYAEDAARTVAAGIVAHLHGTTTTATYAGRGVCYIEFGDGQVGKVEADFLSGPKPHAPFSGPSSELAEEKADFARTRRDRWFNNPR
jgi:sulfide:quinone oxidoreductase